MDNKAVYEEYLIYIILKPSEIRNHLNIYLIIRQLIKS